MEKIKIKIDIVSDVVCPWCYIGKRRLEKAIAASSDRYEFELEYHPFELNPGIPQEGLNQKDYLSDKFGGEERYHQITEHTTGVAAEDGLIFDFSKQTTSPNTRNANSIIDLAQANGKQLETVEAFFKAYFTDGIDLSKNENLVNIAVRAGLKKELIENRLADNDAKLRIASKEKEMGRLGISGVPFYIIDNKYGISGAQHSETFTKAFDEIATKISTLTSSAEACDVDAKNC